MCSIQKQGGRKEKVAKKSRWVDRTEIINRERGKDCSSGGNTRRINWEIENEDLRNKVEQLYGM